jgi:hypothetical protein
LPVIAQPAAAESQQQSQGADTATRRCHRHGKDHREKAAAEKDLATTGKQRTAAAYDLAIAEKLLCGGWAARIGSVIEALSAAKQPQAHEQLEAGQSSNP